MGGDEQELRTWQAWHKIHQPFELRWWDDALKKGHCNDPHFTLFWDEVKEFIKPEGSVIDIGCGPRPPFAPCTVIDTLADKYKALTPREWWKDVKVYTKPAEQQIKGLSGDTIICWNCIDHTIGWRDILDSMKAYGNPGAKFAIATDFHKPFIGHPGFDYTDFMAEIDRRFEVIKRREPFGRMLALVMKAK